MSYYHHLPPPHPQFGQLFNPTIPLGGGGAPAGRTGPPLGKITLDATPALTARLDRLLGTTEKIATEAAATSKLAIGVAVVLGLGALAVALHKNVVATPPRYE